MVTHVTLLGSYQTVLFRIVCGNCNPNREE